MKALNSVYLFHRRRMRHRLPKSALKKLPIHKFKQGDPFETCCICLDDFDEGDKPVVFCSAVGALVELILLERRMFEDGIECKVGVDGGGGFLKICLNIFSHEDFKDTPASSKRRKYSDGICLKDSKNTSVNKLLILAIVPGLPEKYEHISRLFDILKLDQLEEEYYKIRYAADLKMINLLLGLMAHSSAHPCSWCTIDK